jgi:hypothetical protein
VVLMNMLSFISLYLCYFVSWFYANVFDGSDHLILRGGGGGGIKRGLG